MAAYRRVYDSPHLQADCQAPGSAPKPYAQQSSMGYLFYWRGHNKGCWLFMTKTVDRVKILAVSSCYDTGRRGQASDNKTINRALRASWQRHRRALSGRVGQILVGQLLGIPWPETESQLLLLDDNIGCNSVARIWRRQGRKTTRK